MIAGWGTGRCTLSFAGVPIVWGIRTTGACRTSEAVEGWAAGQYNPAATRRIKPKNPVKSLCKISSPWIVGSEHRVEKR